VCSVRGWERPVRLYELSESTQRGPRAEWPAPAPLVGRTGELDTLLSLWRGAAEGRGQLALVSGEPGVGKSRLARELQLVLAREQHVRIELRGAPHSENSTLFPVLDFLQRAWQLDLGGATEHRR